jgi:hypothetical protein
MGALRKKAADKINSNRPRILAELQRSDKHQRDLSGSLADFCLFGAKSALLAS